MPKIEKDAKLDAIVVATLARARPQCVQSRVNWGNAHEYLFKERKVADAARRVREITAARKRVTKAAPELKELRLPKTTTAQFYRMVQFTVNDLRHCGVRPPAN